MEFLPAIAISLKKYLAGKLAKTEVAKLEARLHSEPEWKEELELTKLLISETGELERERLLEMIENVGADEEKEGDVVIRFWRKKVWRVAATVLALMAAGLWWNLSEINKLNDFIADSYFPPINSIDRSGTDDFTLAYMVFEKKEYERSIELLERYSESDTIYYNVLRLQGHNYLKLNQYDKAIIKFNNAIEYQNSHPGFKIEDSENVQWSRLLVMYKLLEEEKISQNEFNNELENFISSSNQNDIYFKKAIQLRSML